MSWVTDIVLFYSVGESESDAGVSPCLTGINAWLREHAHPEMVNFDSHVGGGQAMQANVWGGAFNDLEIEALLDCVKSQPWQEPEEVQVMLKDEEDVGFTLYRLSDIS